MRIFLSHSSQDKELVKRVNSDLLAHKYETWIDHKRMEGGDQLPSEIQNGLEQCKVLILFMSRSSMNSPWVNAEWNNFFARQMDGEELKIIPIRIEKDAQRPQLLRNLLYIDFADLSDYETSLSMLLRALNKYASQEISIEFNSSSVSTIKQYTM